MVPLDNLRYLAVPKGVKWVARQALQVVLSQDFTVSVDYATSSQVRPERLIECRDIIQNLAAHS
ncbi:MULTISPECIES: hypothetical protein [Rhizobium]|uniref:hypothetical protein n=1 Tax=Rhizobium TaxID=379 RepID=UPI000F8855A1|nr:MULTISPECIES: hypothetical protein [Rhizobium]WEA58597.1 hypothetical protein PO860_12835 [Rhizobium sp. BJ04]